MWCRAPSLRLWIVVLCGWMMACDLALESGDPGMDDFADPTISENDPRASVDPGALSPENQVDSPGWSHDGTAAVRGVVGPTRESAPEHIEKPILQKAGRHTPGISEDAGLEAEEALETSSWFYDLDEDGVFETNLFVGPCDAAGTCLHVTSAMHEGPLVIPVSETQNTCLGTLMGAGIWVLGDHTDDGLAEVALAHCQDDGTHAPPAVSVIDIDAKAVMGAAVAPLLSTHGFVDIYRDPLGRYHPFLAPSHADQTKTVNWEFACVFRPDLWSSSACGEGFVSIALEPGGGDFREVGGTVQDLDGDGWEDISLIYLQRVRAISPVTLGIIHDITFDVAATTEPESPPWFHGGRHHGTHAAVETDDVLRTIMVGGAPVGGFQDVLCNESRFVAVLESTPGAASSRHLAWSTYMGFAFTTFDAIDSTYPADIEAAVLRPSDGMNGCIHRFSDSRARMGDEDVVVINRFEQISGVKTCVLEQFAYQNDSDPPSDSATNEAAWMNCMATNLKSKGLWNPRVYRESDGVVVGKGLERYLWGRTADLFPSDEEIYVVEPLPGVGLFDLSDRAVPILELFALKNGTWHARGTLPIAGRPMITHEAPRGARGVGSFTPYAELTTEDLDGDGLHEICLEDGIWVGFDTDAMGLVIKSVPFTSP